MKKLMLIIWLFSSLAGAAEDSSSNENPETKRPVYHTPEVAYYYFKGGTASGNIGETQSDFSYGALGTRRYADEFFYGLEYSSFFGATEYRATSYDLTFGYHLITWRNRIKPYVGANFGYISVKDESPAARPDAKGISFGFDIGLDLMNSGPFKVLGGLHYQHGVLNKNELKDLNFYMLYLGAGIRF